MNPHSARLSAPNPATRFKFVCLICCLGLGLATGAARAASNWRVLADARPNNGVWMASATEGWAVGDLGMINHTTDGGANWTEQVSGVTGNLNGIWGIDTSHVWAVGDGGVVLKYDGTSWAQQASGTTANLQAIHGANVATMWAVGASSTILKGDGANWAIQTVPGGKVTFNGVYAVNATTIWAVGSGGRISKSSDGASWNNQNSGTTQELFGVWASAVTNIFAVGAAPAGQNGTVLRSSNGTNWAAGPASNISGSVRAINGTDATHVWICGDAGTIGLYNGSGSFVAQASTTSQALNSIHSISATAVVAAGARKTFDIFNDTVWTAKSAAIPGVSYNGVWGAEDDNLWFVGAGGTVCRYHGAAFAVTTLGGGVTLNSIWGTDATHLWVAGAGGAIFYWNGASWTQQGTGLTTQALNGISGSNATDVWAVGNAGVILHFNGTSWNKETSNTANALNSVWAASAGAAWAVGAKGTVMKYNGTAWSSQVPIVSQTLTSVGGSGATAIWAIGAAGTVLKSTGAAWAAQAGGTTANLTALVVLNATSQWAAGGTAIIRGNGTAWAADGLTGYAAPITAGWASSVNTVFLASGSGMIFCNSPATVPEITIEQPAGTELASGKNTIDFGTVASPATAVKTFALKSTGTADLTGLTISKSGPAAADFIVSALSSTTLASGAGTLFTVTFLPTADGTRAATISIASNDLDEPAFSIDLTGSGRVGVSFTTQPISKTVNPNTNVTFSCVVNPAASKPLAYQWQKYNGGMMMWEDATGATGANYTIFGAIAPHQGDYRCMVTNPVSVVTTEAATLLVNAPIGISIQPIGATVSSGADVTLTVTATGTAPKYVWKRNGAAIAGAPNAPSYTMTGVQLAQGGDYTVTVSNMVNLQTSSAATVTVVDASAKPVFLPTATKGTLTATFAGKATAYVWKKDNAPLPADIRYTFSKNVLTIAALQLNPMTDAGKYTCEITGADGSHATCMIDLIIYSDPPAILGAEPMTLPDAMVGDPTYSYQIPFDANPLKSPTSFTVAGLPPGLAWDKATGLISGRPNVALTSNKTYAITLTAANAKNKSAKKATLMVKPLPPASVGVFTGPISRETTLNKGLGGKFDMTTTTAGGITGKLMLGAVGYSYTGLLISDVTGANAPSATVTVKRAANLPSLTVTFKVDTDNFRLTECAITDGANATSFSAWLKRWGTPLTPEESEDLKHYLGYYTFGIDPPKIVVLPPATPAEFLPQGLGYGSFTVAASGACTAAGKLADGTAFTSASFCGTKGQVLLFQCLYSNLGSVLGTLVITQGTAGYAPAYGDNTLSGTISWIRPQMEGANHVYRAGFNALLGTAIGGRYVPPAAGAVLFGAADDGLTNNASLIFADGGINGTSTDATGTLINPGIDVRIKPGGVSAPAHNTKISPDPNPRSTTLILAAATGLFSGKATLVDPNPAIPGTNVTRTLNYAGIVFRDSDMEYRGWGYHLLARRPDLKTQTVLTTDILSGVVELTKKN